MLRRTKVIGESYVRKKKKTRNNLFFQKVSEVWKLDMPVLILQENGSRLNTI